MVASDLVLPVTSRTVPRLRGEHELRVLPLPVSPVGGGRDAEKLRARASVDTPSRDPREHPGGGEA
ncbi:hypothetical protein GCM10010464_78910 [Pseudonocardia yunnanensis]|uniref:hypothetical protein n=1 Tax=Pseudonocardia yunnanensis TaxID=58107 RepID=UPI0031E478DB